MEDEALTARAQAAWQLIAEDGELDRFVVLSYVVWPSERLAGEPPPRQARASRAEVEQMVALEASGLSHRQIAERVARPRTTVTQILRRERAGRPEGAAVF